MALTKASIHLRLTQELSFLRTIPSIRSMNLSQVFDLALNEFDVLKTDTTITTFRDVAGATIQLPHGWINRW